MIHVPKNLDLWASGYALLMNESFIKIHECENVVYFVREYRERKVRFLETFLIYWKKNLFNIKSCEFFSHYTGCPEIIDARKGKCNFR